MASGFDGGLLGIEYFEDFDVIALEREVDEVSGIGLNQVFGNGVQISHGDLSGIRKQSVASHPNRKDQLGPPQYSCQGGKTEGRTGPCGATLYPAQPMNETFTVQADPPSEGYFSK